MNRKLKKTIGLAVFIAGIILVLFSIFLSLNISTALTNYTFNNYLHNQISPIRFADFIKFSTFELSFTLGAGFLMIGASILSDAGRKRVWLFSWMLIFAALILSISQRIFSGNYSTIYFGIASIILFLCYSAFCWFWWHNRHKLTDINQIAEDLKMSGYFFFFLALSELSGILIISYNSYKIEDIMTLHQIILHLKIVFLLFIIGWIFTAIAYYYQNSITPHKRILK